MTVPGLRHIRYENGQLTVTVFDPVRGKDVVKYAACSSGFQLSPENIFRHIDGSAIIFHE